MALHWIAILVFISGGFARGLYTYPNHLKPYKGLTAFISFELTNRPWTVQLEDHCSDGYKGLTKEIYDNMKLFDVGSDEFRTVVKIVELSPLDGDKILVKVVLKLPSGPLLEERFFLMWGRILADAKNTNAIEALLGVDPDSFILYSTEKELDAFEKAKRCVKHGKFICQGVMQRFAFQLPDIVWDQKLLDFDSHEFKQLSGKIQQAVTDLLQDFIGFVSVQVTRFSPRTVGVGVKIAIKLIVPEDSISEESIVNQANISKLLNRVTENHVLGPFAANHLLVSRFGEAAEFTVDGIRKAWQSSCRRENSIHGSEGDGYTC